MVILLAQKYQELIGILKIYLKLLTSLKKQIILSNLFTGVDIVDVARIKKSIEKYQDSFLDRIFSKDEQHYCFSKSNPYIHFSGKFAAKEAVMKSVLSSEDVKLIGFLDISIINDSNGIPKVGIKNLPGVNIKISISHTEHQAIAFAIYDKNT